MLALSRVITRQTSDIDVIIFDMMGSEESTLIFHSPLADIIRRIIKRIGKRHGVKQSHLFFNDDCSPFYLNSATMCSLLCASIVNINDCISISRMIYEYILACKLMAARPDKDFDDIAVLCHDSVS